MPSEPRDKPTPRIELVREILAQSDAAKDLSEEEIRMEEQRFFQYLSLFAQIARRDKKQEVENGQTPGETSNPDSSS